MDTPLVVDGPINGQVYRAWVELALVPARVVENLRSRTIFGMAVILSSWETPEEPENLG